MFPSKEIFFTRNLKSVSASTKVSVNGFSAKTFLPAKRACWLQENAFVISRNINHIQLWIRIKFRVATIGFRNMMCRRKWFAPLPRYGSKLQQFPLSTNGIPSINLGTTCAVDNNPIFYFFHAYILLPLISQQVNRHQER